MEVRNLISLLEHFDGESELAIDVYVKSKQREYTVTDLGVEPLISVHDQNDLIVLKGLVDDQDSDPKAH
ncbi:hypothetical protein ABTQ33_04740 [Paucilactobacillus suebicus]|uniref:Uncharacterized protein n=1 Tax=Paucilactobacillus suebicus DSM 5007 = KCTC 3549 TaxID=1423807 RepID=A0A0R1W3S5_9LACO|nr:hypothetical protein [Paucilactobacillus suebicus]KRM12253.1 hypothetical protein FD16_GL002438 [Paucilactobacillus suebicus DSM 5007 = KCTC 3549]